MNDERPREKLARRGAAVLSDAELVALLLRTGAPGRPALSVAEDLLRECPEGPGAGYARLRRVPGVGPARAAALSAAAELARRLKDEDPRPAVPDGRAAAGLFPVALRTAKKEHFHGLYLDARRRLLHQETISVGTLSASLVHPREVFAPALSCSAAAVIVGHNHPSGDPSPSEEDREVTRRLRRAGEIMGLPLLDHVIVAAGRWFSFREHGLL